MSYLTCKPLQRSAWNYGKLIGQKPPLKLKEIWEIRMRLQLASQQHAMVMQQKTK
jgi:hypothetical protein